MTPEEKLAMLKTLTGETNDDLLTVYIEVAEAEVLRRRFPYGVPEGTEFPAEYDVLSVQIAESLYDKRGVEGQISHSENGISRGFNTDGIPKSLLVQITPMAAAVN